MRLPWRRAAIEKVAWVSDDILLAIGWCLASPDGLHVTFFSGGTSQPIDARWIAYPRPDVAAPFGAGRVCLLRLPSPRARHQPGRIVVRAGTVTYSVTTGALSSLSGDPGTVAGWGVGWLDAGSRANILALVCGAVADWNASSVQAAESLAGVRDVLRAALPERPTEKSQPVIAQLDDVVQLTDRSFYLRGWAYVAASESSRLTAVSPEGHRVELLERAFRFRRPDLTEVYGASAGEVGFTAYVQLPAPSIVREGWRIELAARNGYECESAPAGVTTGTIEMLREVLLADVDLDPDARRGLLDTHLCHALDDVAALEAQLTVGNELMQYGPQPVNPEVSIVIPLYKRLDLMEHQLAQLALDPDIRGSEIIYVLDSPELAHELRTVARELHELFHVSFRVMFLTRHLGFAGANNAAVAAAKGRLLLLMNSDVFPIETGWITRMGAFHDRTPNIGALGVKLLYEDDTLQHAGLYFRLEKGSGIWQNQHRFKGFDRNFGPANEKRLVQGVTGACLMIARDRYNEVGGLSGKYLQGDYEDSDLCLRLLAAGYANWYLPEVELYHLEGQSYEWAGRSRISRYNAWTHTRLWNDTITRTSALH